MRKKSCGIENKNYMMRIYDKEVNKITECNLLRDMINPTKRAKYLNSYYYLILHVCINSRIVTAKSKDFLILLYSECSPTIVMVRLVEKLCLEKMLWCSGTRRLEISLLILMLK